MSIQGFNRADLSSLIQQLGATSRGGATRSGNQMSAGERVAQIQKDSGQQSLSESSNKPERKASYSEILLRTQQQEKPAHPQDMKYILSSFSGRPSSPPPSSPFDPSYNPYADSSFDGLSEKGKQHIKNGMKVAEARELGKATLETMPTIKSITRLALEFDKNFDNTISIDELERFRDRPDRVIVGDANAKKIENQLQLADKFIKHYDKIANLDGNEGINQQDLNKLSSLSTTHQGLITEMDYMMLYDKYQNLFA